MAIECGFTEPGDEAPIGSMNSKRETRAVVLTEEQLDEINRKAATSQRRWMGCAQGPGSGGMRPIIFGRRKVYRP